MITRDWNFKGIKFSNTTKIFYTFIGDVLYKFPVYETRDKPEWLESDYIGREGNHKKWVNMTKAQDKDYMLTLRLKKTKAIRSVKNV